MTEIILLRGYSAVNSHHLDALAKALRALDGINPNASAALAWAESLRPTAERDELVDAQVQAWEMDLNSVAAVEAAMEVLQELRRSLGGTD